MGAYITIEDNVILKDIYDAALEKGREQGREQGRRQGEETGMAKLLHRQIEQRFGPLPEWADARIRGASGAELEQWAGNVLTASTLESALRR